jgi:H+-translocating NAD(P) transhydrogenase subunit alpha
MKIAILKERLDGEARVAATPDVVKKYCALGANVSVESGAGLGSSISDEAYTVAGATVTVDASNALQGANIVLCVNAPDASLLAQIPASAHLVGMLSPYTHKALFAAYNAQKLSTYSLEFLPRISRAQSMDVLSSQSNLAGYRAVIDAVAALGKAVPMMMTAAGTVVPAKALVLGAGVAGLQAIATAKRLGAVVSAFDVRPVVKEQVESLGAKFVEVPAEGGETSGGYAKEMTPEYQAKQRQLIHDTIIKQDFVIATALIPGKPAPELITEEMVKAMKSGSVIVDLAAASGGNCKLTEADKSVIKHGVTLIGATNLPSRVAADATALYARNLYTFVTTLLINKEGTLAPQMDDELIKGTLINAGGETVHPTFK